VRVHQRLLFRYVLNKWSLLQFCLRNLLPLGFYIISIVLILVPIHIFRLITVSISQFLWQKEIWLVSIISAVIHVRFCTGNVTLCNHLSHSPHVSRHWVPILYWMNRDNLVRTTDFELGTFTFSGNWSNYSITGPSSLYDYLSEITCGWFHMMSLFGKKDFGIIIGFSHFSWFKWFNCEPLWNFTVDLFWQLLAVHHVFKMMFPLLPYALSTIIPTHTILVKKE